jgi:hypothetical protein
MQARIMNGMQHVLIYEDKAIQQQALEKIPVEEIKRKALESPGQLQPRDAVARHLLRLFFIFYFFLEEGPRVSRCRRKTQLPATLLFTLLYVTLL